MRDSAIPLYRPNVSEDDIQAVANTLRSGHLTRCEETEKFEQEFADFVGRKYAVAVNSGTSALHLAVKAHGFRVGDKVLTSAFSYVATTNAILFERLEPFFGDIDPHTFNLSFSLAGKADLDDIRGILLPHIFGVTAELDSYRAFMADRPRLTVMEDACQALVPATDQSSVGKFSETSVYSLHENKIITAGEGGMIATDNPTVYEACRSLRDQGRSESKDWLRHTRLGFNFRITEMQAALARSQLRRYSQIRERLDSLVNRYLANLRKVGGVSAPQDIRGRLWNFFYVTVNEPDKREEIRQRLAEKGILTASHYFPPIYRFAHVSNNMPQRNLVLPNTERASASVLVLPLYAALMPGEIDYVCDSLKDAIEKKG